VLQPDNDVYEEVVKPLLDKFKLDVEPSFSVQPPPDSTPDKKHESISIVSKLTLVIFEHLFHNYFAFYFLADVLCFMHRYLA